RDRRCAYTKRNPAWAGLFTQAAGLGFEPRLLGPEPSVLPLDDPATGPAKCSAGLIKRLAAAAERRRDAEASVGDQNLACDPAPAGGAEGRRELRLVLGGGRSAAWA